MHNRDCTISSSCGWSCSLRSWTGPWLPRAQPARLLQPAPVPGALQWCDRQGGSTPPFPVQAAVAHRQNNTIFHERCYIHSVTSRRTVSSEGLTLYLWSLAFKKITVFSFFLDITGSHLYIQAKSQLGKNGIINHAWTTSTTSQLPTLGWGSINLLLWPSLSC